MSDGYVVRGHRHNDAILTAHNIPRYKDERPYADDQGFITSENQYVNRQEAYKIFTKNKTVSANEKTHPIAGRNELYSEDLY